MRSGESDQVSEGGSSDVRRLGVTVPLPNRRLVTQRDDALRLTAAGYTDVWTAEGPGVPDGFTPLAVASAVPGLRLGTGVIPVFTRGPATLAQCAATLADTAPGRVVIGIGSSSRSVVEDWNDARFERPYARVRDMLRFLRLALDGEQVEERFDSFAVTRFRLSTPPDVPPRLMVAALRERMLRLAGREADGAVLTLLAAEDVPRLSGIVHAEGDRAEIVARVLVVPSEDPLQARHAARRLLATYLNVPVYAEFHRWLGHEDALRACWDLWASGRRQRAAEAIPNEVVDMFAAHGSPAQCRARLEQYRAAGVDTPVVGLVPVGGVDTLAAACAIAEVGP